MVLRVLLISENQFKLFSVISLTSPDINKTFHQGKLPLNVQTIDHQGIEKDTQPTTKGCHMVQFFLESDRIADFVAHLQGKKPVLCAPPQG
jgi:hypothetical protein